MMMKDDLRENKNFEVLLNEFLARRREDMLAQFNRVLPTGELLFNRFDKAKFVGAGKRSSIYDSSVIMGDVTIGDDVWVGPFTLIEGIHGKVNIGNWVSINTGAMILSHDSTKYYVTGGNDSFKKGDVTIGSYTVIGSQSFITCGVSIGSHCVIAAGSFVNKDVKDNSIVAGAPARKIGSVLIHDGKAEFKFF